LEKLGGNDKLTDFSYFQLVTGKTWETYEKELNYKNRVDYKLLNNLGAAREQIIKQFSPTDENDEVTKKRYVKIANALLGKIIFVRYLIDRKVKIYFDGESKERTNEEFCNILQRPDIAKLFFNILADKDVGFNGDLFRLEDDEYKETPKAVYSILIKLLTSQEVATGQQSLFDLYDFSIIPIEFISNIYEYFIGSKNQAKQGAYYTPLFLVDYILSETIEKYISKNQTYICKVLDPACGSGVFLVETLRKMIEKYKENAPNDREQFKNDIKDIAQNNIYGIDKDESATQVAIFSIYLTLLDYMQPPEIAGFKFPKLKDSNFFCSDFFDKKAKFNTVFANIQFDYIIGNPPWFRGKNEAEKPMYVKYIEERKKKERRQEIQIEIGNKEIAQAFLLRNSDFSTENTKCALIVTSKVLYNLQSKNFRKYFLHNYFIERVFELAPVNTEIFNSAKHPACVLFFRDAKNKNTDTNLIEYIALKPSRFFSMFKIFSVYRHDIQTVQQDRLKKDDWLWKVLVYGSYLDFNFIKRLQDDYLTIERIIKENNFKKGQGITVGGGDKNDASELIGMPIKTDSDIRKFWLNPNNTKKWERSTAHRPRNKELYKSPVLLIKNEFPKDFSLISAISYINAVYTDTLIGIKGELEQIDILRQIMGIINSNLATYLNLMTASEPDRKIYQEEILRLPYLQISDISDIIIEMEDLIDQDDILDNQDKLLTIQHEIEKYLYHAFVVSDKEKALIDYAHKIIIPVQKKHTDSNLLYNPCDITLLTDYAQLFIERLASNFEKIGKKFVVEIWYTQQIVGMFFKVISTAEYKEDVVWINKQTDISGLFQTIIQLGATKITDQLFIQKDIRGFKKEYFYVFKPNEKRLWHKAVGYLDVEEFADAILRAGRYSK
jgi:hypothetical protein